MFGPELIWINALINQLIKTARSAVSKNYAERGFFLRCQPRNFGNVTLVARQRVHFRGFLAIFLVVQLPPKRGVLANKNSLASYQRCSHSVEPRALTCPFKQSNLSAWSYPNLYALGEAFPLLYVVSYKLFWNWNGVVRFVSQEVWFDKGFVIWHFLNYSLVQIMSLWSLSIGVGIIFTTNELVNRTRNFKSNASQFKQKKYEKNPPQARFFMKPNAPQARFFKQNALQARIFDAVLMGTLSYLYSM